MVLKRRLLWKWNNLILVLLEVLDGVDGPGVELEVRHYELREAMRGDFLREWWVGGSQAARFYLLLELLTCFLDPLPNNHLNVLDARDLRSLCGLEFSESLSSLGRSDLADLWLLLVWVVLVVRDGRPLIFSGLWPLKDLDLSDELTLDTGCRVNF